MKLFFLICYSLIFWGCENIKNKNEYKNESTTRIKILKIDTSINGIILDDTISVVKKINDIKNSIEWKNCECAVLYNKSKTEFFKLHHSNGGFANQFDIFTVGYTKELENKKSKQIKSVNDDLFITENGIKLGLTENEFIKIFPTTKFIKNKSDNETIEYKFHDIDNTYLSSYKFKNGILINFTFGYDNS